MQVLFDYECSCGEAFVICASAPARAGAAWRRDARRVAEALGRGYVDASADSFACPACGTVHERAPRARAA